MISTAIRTGCINLLALTLYRNHFSYAITAAAFLMGHHRCRCWNHENKHTSTLNHIDAWENRPHFMSVNRTPPVFKMFRVLKAKQKNYFSIFNKNIKLFNGQQQHKTWSKPKDLCPPKTKHLIHYRQQNDHHAESQVAHTAHDYKDLLRNFKVFSTNKKKRVREKKKTKVIFCR